MSIRLLRFEGRKLLEQPMVFVFFLACLLLNSLYILQANLDQGYLQYIQNTQKQTGTFVTSAFKEELAQQPANQNQQRLLTDIEEVSPVFKNYSTEHLAQRIIDFYQIDGNLAGKIRLKYEKLAPVLQDLAETNASLEVAAAGETMGFLKFITHQLFRAILGESLIFALLLGLFASTSEKASKTEGVVLSTKTGRPIQFCKYGASFGITLLFYILLLLFGFSLLNLIHPYGNLWQTSVSSYFHLNVYFPQLLELPFMTWSPQTLASYTRMSLAFGGLLIIICHGFNFLIGLWTNHLFRGFVIFVTLYCLLVGMTKLSSDLGLWALYSQLMWHPISLWQNQGYWFTEMGPYSTLPWQESIAGGIHLLLLTLGAIITGNYYSKKEVH